MKVMKIADIKAEESTGKIFRGKVTSQPLNPEDEFEYRIGVVNFSPGAVNIFHTHTRDQILVVTEGTGTVATEKEEVTVTPGSVIFIPAGEKHWHGATKDSAFSHISILPLGSTTAF